MLISTKINSVPSVIEVMGSLVILSRLETVLREGSLMILSRLETVLRQGSLVILSRLETVFSMSCLGR